MKHTLSHLGDRVMTPENAWTAVSVLSVVAGAMIGRTLLKSGWRAATGTEPPQNPDDDDTLWREALAWGVSTGAIIGVVRALARKGSSAAERHWS